MADPQILTTLRRKQADIEEAIAAYEAKIEEARRDLSAVNATIRIFEINATPRGVKVYTDLHRLFKWGEMASVCLAALASEGSLDTRELTLRVLRSKGLDEADPVLRKAITARLIHVLTQRWKRGGITDAGRRKGGIRVWGL